MQYDRRVRAQDQAPPQEVLTHSTPQHSRVPATTLPTASAVTFAPPPSDVSDSAISSSSAQNSTLSSTVSDSNPPIAHCTNFSSSSTSTSSQDQAPNPEGSNDSGVDTSPPAVNANQSIISRFLSYLK